MSEHVSYCAQTKNAKLFPYTQDHRLLRVGFGMQVANTPTHPVVCRFALFVTQSTDVTDGRTDVHDTSR